MSFNGWLAWLSALALAMPLAWPSAACAINVQMDYRYDTAGFFNQSTPSGQTARAAVDAAAAFFSSIIDDALSAIPFADPSTPGFDNTPVWRQVIRHPGTGDFNYSISSAASAAQDGLTASQGAANEFRDIHVPSNQFFIYAGATSLGTAGEGGTGVAYYGPTNFNDTIARRGKPEAEYSAWGGYVAFDNDGVNWHLNHTQPVAANKLDLYSVALHEIGHVLGLNPTVGGGNAPQWDAHQVGAEFRGPSALAAWKADDPSAPLAATGVPTVSSSNTHWKDNVSPSVPSVRSKIIGTHTLQEVAMDPVILTGTRKHFTNVDAMSLRDIGWSIPNSVFDVTPTFLAADFNEDTSVNGADLAMWRSAFGATATADADADGDSDGRDFLIWQRQLGMAPAAASLRAAGAAVPEPASAMLAAAAFAAAAAKRRRRLRGF